MGLGRYKEKRNFKKTPEPPGKETSSKGALKFVIQKHHASHLHYDFRLEMEGVLKSWAVPKGPSLNPKDKRLAMMVEDHPMEYRKFEGIIPQGNYGGGTVMIWDEGTYEALEEPDRGKGEKALLRGLHAGSIKIRMNGQKLKGEFALVKMKDRGENAWLLIKHRDEHASSKDITKSDRSVVSGRTLDEIKEQAEGDGAVWRSNRETKSDHEAQPAPHRKTKDQLRIARETELEDARKAAFPHDIKPMLATLVDAAFDRDDWLFEIKWDGYRAMAEVNGNKVDVYSRNLISFNDRYPAIREALKELGMKAVLDGEIVCVDENGMASFQLLQQHQRTGEGTLIYYVFDILYLDGYDLTELPLWRRKEILQQALPEHDTIRYSDHVEENGIDLYEAAQRQGLEGIIAKNMNSPYRIDARSKEWLKIKTHMRQEAIVCGFTEARGGRKHFGALVLGLYNEDGELVYIGHTGGGFNTKSLKEVMDKLEPLVTDKMPFGSKPKTNMPVTWVKPKLVCEVVFQEWTEGGHMRQPIFQGMRIDKAAKDVHRESAEHTEDVKTVKSNASAHALRIVHNRHEGGESAAAVKKAPAKKAAKKAAKKSVAKKTVKKATAKKSTAKKITAKKTAAKKVAAKKTSKKESTSKKSSSHLPAIDIANGEDQVIKVSGQELKLTNLDKVYWKKEKYTKLDLINYYRRISPYILPYLKDRPESLNRHPNGIDGKNFFQKDVGGKVAEWIPTVEVFSESNSRNIDYLLCQDEATLLYLANMGCIEINPWHSRLGSLDYPDYCLIDLDPHEISFEKVIETACVVKEVLDELKIPAYCKTSGSSGLHICIPLGAKYDFDQSKTFAELIVSLVYDRIPSFTSLERSPSKRRRKVYLDFLQNRQTQTVAAPYCVRPKPGATVSTPLFWDEVKKGLSPSQFTIKNIFDRLEKVGDIWKPVHGKGIDMEECLQRIIDMKSGT
jgi:bifunctional non-homologous end joining protein LigD